jgi:hypothetical protein
MSIPNKTYNNLIDTLKELGDKHQQISTTTVGDIFVMDLVEPDNANEQDVYNDVLQTCIDIISIFRNSKWQAQLELDIDAPVYFTEGDYTLEPFTERFDQSVTGWVFQIGIVVANDFQSCVIPMENTYIGQ